MGNLPQPPLDVDLERMRTFQHLGFFATPEEASKAYQEAIARVGS